MGHNLGLSHDTENCVCGSSKTKKGCIMSESVGWVQPFTCTETLKHILNPNNITDLPSVVLFSPSFFPAMCIPSCSAAAVSSSSAGSWRRSTLPVCWTLPLQIVSTEDQCVEMPFWSLERSATAALWRFERAWATRLDAHNHITKAHKGKDTAIFCAHLSVSRNVGIPVAMPLPASLTLEPSVLLESAATTAK